MYKIDGIVILIYYTNFLLTDIHNVWHLYRWCSFKTSTGARDTICVLQIIFIHLKKKSNLESWTILNLAFTLSMSHPQFELPSTLSDHRVMPRNRPNLQDIKTTIKYCLGVNRLALWKLCVWSIVSSKNTSFEMKCAKNPATIKRSSVLSQ